MKHKGTIIAMCVALLAGSVQANLLEDGSFEGGAAKWKFMGYGGQNDVDAGWIGKWTTSQSNEDHGMDLADVSQPEPWRTSGPTRWKIR